jgi:hypothetical protein
MVVALNYLIQLALEARACSPADAESRLGWTGAAF